MDNMGFHGCFFFVVVLAVASSLVGINGLRPSKTSKFADGSSTTQIGSTIIAASGDMQSDGEANRDGSPWNSLGRHNTGILEHDDTNSLNRQSFPTDFLFGTSSSSYQFEGASKAGGKSPSIWDVYLHKYPDRVKDGSTGAIGVDAYNRYKEDVGIMKEIGFNAYRFSISWPRILPRGHLRGGVNEEGIAYYNNLIDELISKGLQPFVTIFHWDLPQTLEDEYGGFLSPKIVKDFTDYAQVCYEEFGDRVKNWITVNEPYNYAVFGYGTGNFPPGRCSGWVSLNCSGGDSGVEPYTVAHHQLLAHASAVKLYRDKYQMTQNGRVGIALIAGWTMPLSLSTEDKEAAQRAIAFESGWFLEPLYFGSYPAEMVKYVGERLPKFSNTQSAMLKGSLDFIGINYYTSRYAADTPCKTDKQSVLTDSCVSLTTERNGVSIGPKAASNWLYIYPTGIYHLLLHIKYKYQNPVTYVTENGMDEINDGTISLEDTTRIDFYYQHLSHVRNAIQDGVKVKGYFVWSLLDNFEWMEGYTLRYGIVYVDYKNGLKRYPKTSSKWFQKLLNQHTDVQVQMQ